MQSINGSNVLGLATTVAPELGSPKTFTFNVTDYVVFVVMLMTSASIGVYFGFFSKSKNTTDEYLMGSKKMRTIPIAISLVASQLSAIAIMSVPAENYSFGFNYFFGVVSMLFVAPVLCYIIIPVFYENNISNCYEYLEMRFNKGTRQLVTASFVLNAIMMLPVIIFVPALAFAQVSGLNIHLINFVVCSICVFYTMLGGIKAVVWTDVVQAGIMISSVMLVAILGISRVGGVGEVVERATEGGRLHMNLSWDPRTRMTVWNALIGGGFMWLGHIGLNQSCVQRIVSLPSLAHAKKSLYLATVGFIIIMGTNAFIGIIMYARYYDCDPIKAGHVEKPDKLMPFFVQDIMGHLKGMPGIFISCVFSAALSTMSAILNSLAGVVYFDYIRPFIKHTDARANFIMKIFVVVMGGVCVVAGLIVQKFNSILQMVITITGINTGAVVGVFLLGMFVPRANGKVAIVSIAVSIIAMFWIIMMGQVRFRQGAIIYDPLPTTIENCKAYDLEVLVKSIAKTDLQSPIPPTVTEAPKVTHSLSSNRDFSIYEISFYWYKVLGMVLVWVVAIPLSYVWKRDRSDKLNIHLYSPFIRTYVRHKYRIAPEIREEMPLKSELSEKDGNMTILCHETEPTIGITLGSMERFMELNGLKEEQLNEKP